MCPETAWTTSKLHSSPSCFLYSIRSLPVTYSYFETCLHCLHVAIKVFSIFALCIIHFQKNGLQLLLHIVCYISGLTKLIFHKRRNPFTRLKLIAPAKDQKDLNYEEAQQYFLVYILYVFVFVTIEGNIWCWSHYQFTINKILITTRYICYYFMASYRRNNYGSKISEMTNYSFHFSWNWR